MVSFGKYKACTTHCTATASRHLNERMNEMSGEFANMLHETLERRAELEQGSFQMQH